MPERSRATRLRVGIGIALVALLVLAGAGVLVLRSLLSPERLRAEVTHTLQDATGLEVTLRRVSLSYAPPGVAIEGLRVGGDSGEPPLLELEDALARLELAPLLRRSVVVSRLVLTRPQVFLRQGAEGLVLPGKLGGPPPDAAPPTLPPAAAAPVAAGFGGAIRSFEIDDGVLQIDAPEGGEDLRVEGVALRGTLDLEPGGRRVRSHGVLSLGSLSIAALEPYRDTLDRLQPEIRFQVEYRPLEGSLLLDSLRLSAPPLDLPFRGEARGLPTQPRLELTLEPRTLEIAELLPLVPSAVLPPERRVEGRGPVTVAARYVSTSAGAPAAQLEARAEFQGAELAMSGGAVRVADLRGSVELAGGRLTLRDLRGSLDGEPFALSGDADALAEPDGGRYDVSVRAAIDLAHLSRAALVPEGTDPAGRATVDLRARGAWTEPAPVAVTGTIDLENVSATAADLPVRAEGWSGALEMTGTDLRVKRLGGRLGRSVFELSGRVRDALTAPKVELEGRCPRLDLVELSPAPETAAAAPLVPLLPPFPLELRLTVDSLHAVNATMAGVTLTTTGAEGSGHAAVHVGSADLEGLRLQELDVGVDLHGPAASGTFRAQRVNAYDRLPLTGVAGTLRAGEDRVLHLENLTGALWGGTAEGTVRLDLGDPAAPGFDIQTTAKGVQAGTAFASLTPARDIVHGTMDFSSSFSGKGATAPEIVSALTGQGTLNAREGKLEASPTTRALWKALKLDAKDTIPFRDLATAFAVRDGKLVTEDLRVAGTDATWKASGAVAFDGTLDYRIEVELSDELSGLVRKRLGSDLAALLAGESDRLVVDLDVRGPANDPKVVVDRDKLAERARSNLGDQVDRAVDKAKNDLRKLFGGN